MVFVRLLSAHLERPGYYEPLPLAPSLLEAEKNSGDQLMPLGLGVALALPARRYPLAPRHLSTIRLVALHGWVVEHPRVLLEVPAAGFVGHQVNGFCCAASMVNFHFGCSLQRWWMQQNGAAKMDLQGCCWR